MYFPIIRGKQYDLLALRDVSAKLAAQDDIVPIIEPCKTNGSVKLSFSGYVAANMRFGVVINPCVGDLDSQDVEDDIIDYCLDEYDNYYIAINIDERTQKSFLEDTCKKYEGLSFIAVYYGAPQKEVENFLLSTSSFDFHLFRHGKTPTPFRAKFPVSKKGIIEDHFNRQERNADYEDEEFFSDAHLRVPNEEYHNFGDYSVVGAGYSDGGGAAYAVALHHVYAKADEKNALYIRHYVSDSNDTPTDPGGKFLEALDKLVADLNILGHANLTDTCDEYRDLHVRQHFPGLGYAKKLGMTHHLEIMMKMF